MTPLAVMVLTLVVAIGCGTSGGGSTTGGPGGGQAGSVGHGGAAGTTSPPDGDGGVGGVGLTAGMGGVAGALGGAGGSAPVGGSGGRGDSGGSTGGAATGGSGGIGGAGKGGTVGTGTGGSGTGGTGTGGSGTAGTGAGELSFGADRVVVTGVRGTTTPAATSVIGLHNGGQAAVQISGLSIGSQAQLTLGPSGMPVQATSQAIAGAALFQIVNPPSFPVTLGAGADLSITVQLSTTGSNLPAAPTNKDLGSTLLTASLSATSSAGSAQVTVYGLVLIQDNYEPTLGQILIALGYKLDVGQAQNNWNPNTSMMAANLPGIEAGTDEVAAPHFIKAGAGTVSLTLVARFSPVGALPYGWYPASSATTLNTVGTMSMITDGQTSDKARMVYPPLQVGSATAFDPGAAAFGIWVYSDQKTEKYDEGGNVVNGDYDYSQDALNVPAGGIHRFKAYPLKNASGVNLAQQYLLAVEEAGNGDYQDYVFVLGNVNAAP
ncbi:MAG TPA: hypothetical protein VFG23_20100 [Polyangia bacterium]|nr:hypothetical protein [Polyangia bacterium]